MSAKKVIIIFLLFLSAAAFFITEETAMAQNPFPRRLDVPPLPADLTWLNTDQPLKLEDLRGKFVLLDFWTYCCINCMHILPELKELEKNYADNLVVIGVHSAKFDTEKDTKNITEAILRYEIEHPVINDWQFKVWRQFGAQAWPTVVLIDPEGKAVWGRSGEITAGEVREVLAKAMPYYRKKGLLDTKPQVFQRESGKAEESLRTLKFPGKVLADEPGRRLFIADSNHNRIVVAGLDGKLIGVIGSGSAGRSDGDYQTASFNKPQGMALKGETLYVADTENHLLRAVDLGRRQVRTVAGTGRQNRKPAADLTETRRPRQTALNSPWALYVHEGFLYIAMAGAHQIWIMPLDEKSIGPYAGNGQEDIVDGRLLPRRLYSPGYASFAQPSGLAGDGRRLYVADSEGSSIRAVPFDRGGPVTTVVGTADLPSARLFTFGDADGPADRARLQHPLGVVYHAGRLYVADTYNNKIKSVDPATGEVVTLKLIDETGADATAGFNEPAGISAAADKLYVADTNNHRIAVIDLNRKTNGAFHVSTLGLQIMPKAITGAPG